MSAWMSMWLLASILLFIASMVLLTAAGPSVLGLAFGLLSTPGIGYGWIGYYAPTADR